jgi:hypothetical protein
MKKLLITDTLLILSLVFLLIGIFRVSNLTNENKKIKQELETQKTTIKDLEDALSEREREIMFWGMKYDSIKRK